MTFVAPSPLYPTVITSATEVTTATGQIVLTVIDFQARVTSVEFQTQIGTAAPSGWTVNTSTSSGFTSSFTHTVTFTAGTISYIRWRVVGFNHLGQPDQILSQGEVLFPLVTQPSSGATDILATQVFGP